MRSTTGVPDERDAVHARAGPDAEPAGRGCDSERRGRTRRRSSGASRRSTTRVGRGAAPARPTRRDRSARATGRRRTPRPTRRSARGGAARRGRRRPARSAARAASQSARSTAKSGTKHEPSRKRNDWKLVSSRTSAPSVPSAVVRTTSSDAAGPAVRGSAARRRPSRRSRTPRPSPPTVSATQREERDEAAGRDRGGQRRGVGDVARQEHDRAEREEERVGDAVADPGAPERARAGCARSGCSRPRAGSTRP